MKECGWRLACGRDAVLNHQSTAQLWARLKILDFDVLRFTWRQETKASREVVATIRELLRRSAVA